MAQGFGGKQKMSFAQQETTNNIQNLTLSFHAT
jgi:hypothetical protein